MITKAIIGDRIIGTNTYTVSVPFLDSSVGETGYRVATISSDPAISEEYKSGDVVYVGFEDHKADKIVILGRLYVDTNESRGHANFESLDVKNNATLPNSTVVGSTKLSTIINKVNNLPDETLIIPNPSLSGSEYDLTGLQIGNLKYKVPTGSMPNTYLVSASQSGNILTLTQNTGSSFVYTPNMGISQWGDIGGSISNQIDLMNEFSKYVPYSNASSDLNLGQHSIYANNIIALKALKISTQTSQGSENLDILFDEYGENFAFKVGDTHYQSVFHYIYLPDLNSSIPQYITLATDLDLNSCIKKNILTTKGDIMYASLANSPTRLGIGTSGQFLRVGSANTPIWESVTIPKVYDATLTLQLDGDNVGTFTANASSNKAININLSSAGYVPVFANPYLSADSVNLTGIQVGSIKYNLSLYALSSVVGAMNYASVGALSADTFIPSTYSDVGAASAAHTHNYLPLSGGTLASTNGQMLYLKRTSQNGGAFIGFKHNNQDTNVWFVGGDSSDNLRISHSTDGGTHSTKELGIDTDGNVVVTGSVYLSSISSSNEVVKRSDLDSYVTLSTAQTITGNKEFEGNVTISDGMFYIGTDENANTCAILGPLNGFSSNRIIRLPDNSGTFALVGDLSSYATISSLSENYVPYSGASKDLNLGSRHLSFGTAIGIYSASYYIVHWYFYDDCPLSADSTLLAFPVWQFSRIHLSDILNVIYLSALC